MAFALVNEKMGAGARVFIAGVCDLPIGTGVVITPVIFNANLWDTEGAALEFARDVPGKWSVTEIFAAGSSEDEAQ